MLLYVFVTAIWLLLLAWQSKILQVRFWPVLTVFLWYGFLSVFFISLFGGLGIPSDAGTYDRQALTLAYEWNGLGDTVFARDVSGGKEGFQHIVAALYYLGGRAPIAGMILNSGFVASAFLMVAAASRNLDTNSDLTLQFLCFLTWPVFLLMGPGLLREPINWFSLASLALGLTLLRNPKSRLVGMALIAAAIALLWWVRLTLAMLVIIGLVVGLFFVQARRLLRGRLGLVAFIGFSLLALALLAPQLLEMSGNDQQRLEVVRGALSRESASAYNVNLASLLSMFGDIGFVIANVPHVIFGPFPWELGPEPVWLWVMAGTLYWWILLYTVFKAARCSHIKPEVSILLITALVILVGLSASSTNYGLVVRMRGLPAILLLVVIGSSSLNLVPSWLRRDGAVALYRPPGKLLKNLSRMR